jgi:putative intracellular protease/amidase
MAPSLKPIGPIPLPLRDRRAVETFPCAICGGPAVIIAADAETGTPIRICADHLPAEARAVYDRLRARGWRAPAPRVRALFDAHPYGQRVGQRIKMEFD